MSLALGAIYSAFAQRPVGLVAKPICDVSELVAKEPSEASLSLHTLLQLRCLNGTSLLGGSKLLLSKESSEDAVRKRQESSAVLAGLHWWHHTIQIEASVGGCLENCIHRRRYCHSKHGVSLLNTICNSSRGIKSITQDDALCQP